MWGRLATCGRLSIGLPTSMQMPTRRVDNPPQADSLPHEFRTISNAAKSMRHWVANLPHKADSEIR
jgi:hypothetical protein